MAKENFIELLTGLRIPILYEDRSVLAIDKPFGWMLVPFSWQRTSRNLQAALTSSIAARDFWARSRNLKFLQFVHRLDADTTGILLFAKSQGALKSYADLFEGRLMEKIYLAVARGEPKQTEWTCHFKLAPDPRTVGRMIVDEHAGKEAETRFRVLQSRDGKLLIEARPLTGRTHQIRIHLAESGLPVVGDELYGKPAGIGEKPLGLRAIDLAYSDPFTRKRVEIRAPVEHFIREYGFEFPMKKKLSEAPSITAPHKLASRSKPA